MYTTFLIIKKNTSEFIAVFVKDLFSSSNL